MKSTGEKKIYFVSDLHLGSEKGPKYFLFLNFLKKLQHGQDVSHLFLCGDIFDLWIWQHLVFVQRYQEVVDELKKVTSAGIAVHYFEGNHDLYLTDFFAKQLGCQVWEDPQKFVFGKKAFYVEHGDQMDPEDIGYRLLRWFWRTPLLRFLTTVIPGTWQDAFGRSASVQSSKKTRGQDGESVSVTGETQGAQSQKTKVHKFTPEEWAKELRLKLELHVLRVLRKVDVDVMVSGHVHVAMDFEVKNRDQKSVRVINLGSWLGDETPRALVYDVDADNLYFEKIV